MKKAPNKESLEGLIHLSKYKAISNICSHGKEKSIRQIIRELFKIFPELRDSREALYVAGKIVKGAEISPALLKEFNHEYGSLEAWRRGAAIIQEKNPLLRGNDYDLNQKHNAESLEFTCLGPLYVSLGQSPDLNSNGDWVTVDDLHWGKVGDAEVAILKAKVHEKLKGKKHNILSRFEESEETHKVRRVRMGGKSQDCYILCRQSFETAMEGKLWIHFPPIRNCGDKRYTQINRKAC